MPTIELYYRSTELESYQNISTYDETDQRIPAGYQYYYARNAPLYSKETNKKIGTFIGNNTYQVIDRNVGLAYCNLNTTLFIENTLPIGTISYINTFTTKGKKPNLSIGTYYPLVLGGTYFYNTIKMSIVVMVDSTEVRNITITY